MFGVAFARSKPLLKCLGIVHLDIATLLIVLKGQIFITLGLRPKDDSHTNHLPERQDKINLLMSHTH